MTKPKANPTPQAPFNLRVTGPMKPVDIQRKLGKGYRLAHSHGDSKATLDADPCPHCGTPVEWAQTSTTENGKTVPYVYARCQGRQRHAWGFSNMASKRDRMELVAVDTTPPPRPSAGSLAMGEWIRRKQADLEQQVKALSELQRLAAVVGGVPLPLASPQPPIPPNGDPTPPHRH